MSAAPTTLTIRPVLRWTGSKRLLIPSLLRLLPSGYTRYVEPFAGSACLFFAARPRAAVLSDLNADLIDTYESLRDELPPVLAALSELDPSGDDYYQVRSVDRASVSGPERAAHFIYLNRHSFNGVYRTNKAGRFNVPRGKRVGSMPSAEELAAASSALKAARLRKCDFAEVVANVEPGDFVYLDPPYSRAIRPHYGLYGYGSFAREDEGRLMAALRAIDARGARFVLSYNVSAPLDLPTTWRVMEIDVRRQVGAKPAHRRSARELVITNGA